MTGTTCLLPVLKRGPRVRLFVGFCVDTKSAGSRGLDQAELFASIARLII